MEVLIKLHGSDDGAVSWSSRRPSVSADDHVNGAWYPDATPDFPREVLDIIGPRAVHQHGGW
ncbi:MAG: hypothetical protein WCJ30_11105 [Deltaproteobacteria bacterium]